RVYLYQRYFSSWRGNGSWDRRHGGGTIAIFDAISDPPPWRNIRIDVRSDKIFAWWEDGPKATEFDLTELEESNQKYLAERRSVRPGDATVAQVDPSFARHGGIGLYIHGGSAAFRNVVLEPSH